MSHLPPITSEQLKQCRSEIEQWYLTGICMIQTDPRSPLYVVPLKDIFTRVVIKQERRHTGRKKSIDYTELFNTEIDGISPKRLLLQGEGGTGKSTLCAKIALDWIEKTNFQEFEMVLVISLPEAKGKTVGDIVKTYLSDSNEVQPRQLDDYIVSNPDKVLLILDAFDEMNADLTDLYFIIEVLLIKRFMSCTVLVTTRPWKADLIRQAPALRKAYAFIYVEGFNRADLSTYINKYFEQDMTSANELIKLMEDNKIIAEYMAPFPIYAAMISIMWREYDGERRKAMQELHTVSQLFTEMIYFLCDHFESKKGQCSGDMSTEECLAKIGQVAFRGLLERKVIFAEKDFDSAKVMETGCQIGVLTAEQKPMQRKDRNRSGQLYPVTFPHKLFQEYHAALHLQSLFKTDHEQYETLMKGTICRKLQEYKYFLYFSSSRDVDIALDIIKDMDQTTDNFIEDVVDLAFESQHQEVAREVWKKHLSNKRELRVHEDQSAHTVYGYFFIMEESHLVKILS